MILPIAGSLLLAMAACGLAGAQALFGASRALLEELRNKHSLPGIIAWATPVIAIVLSITNLLVAAGFYIEYSPITCLALLIYLLWVSMMYFISLLVPE